MFEDVADAVHRIAAPEVWHRGLTLARDGAARIVLPGPTSWVFAVGRERETRVTWQGTQWHCECLALARPCEHIAAAACAASFVGLLLEAMPDLLRAHPRTTVRLRSEGSTVFFSVVETLENRTGEVTETLLTGDPHAASPVVAAIPRGSTEGRLWTDNVGVIFAHLIDAEEVTFDGRPVRVDPPLLNVSWFSLPSAPWFKIPLTSPGEAKTLYYPDVLLRGSTLQRLEYASRSQEEWWGFSLGAMIEDGEHGPRRYPPGVLAGLMSWFESLRPWIPQVPRTPPRPMPAPPDSPRVAAPTVLLRGLRPPDPAPAAPTPRVPPRPRPPPTLRPRWIADGERPGVVFSAVDGGGREVDVPAEQVTRAWRSRADALRLNGHDLACLPRDWLEQYGEILEQFLATRGARGEVPIWARPAAARLCKAVGAAPPPDLAGLEALVGDFSGVPAAAIPEELRARLREYQRRGVDWLCLLRRAGLGALLADDMGLGKTLQMLCAIDGRTLVVAPTSTLHNWAAELRRFRPELRVCVFHGPRRRIDQTADVTLTNYAILRLSRELLAQEAWDIVVLDEAQAIKDPGTATAGAACALPARWRVALTGTPVENRLTELWSIFDFLNPGLLGSRQEFVKRYEKPIARGAADATAALQTRVRPFLLRRRKSEVARELPPRTEVVLRCTLDAAERRAYDALRTAAHAEVVERLSAGGSVVSALELLLRLRQAACHLALVPGLQAERSSKVELLVEQLQEVTAEGHRALVFSQWTGLLDRVEGELTSAGLGFVRLDGDTVDRAGVVHRFQAPDGPPLMLISLRAGGTGLNLTAADHVYILDPWWNPAVEDQAADRAHRIGQERPVFVHRLVAEDTVEEKILELHARKRELAVTMIDGAGTPSLTREDLLELLR